MYSLKGELDNAIAQYEKAISFQPDLPEALYHLAKLHIKKNELSKAKFGQKGVDQAIKLTLDNYKRALVEPGEAVGESAGVNWIGQ